jgi:ribosomal-protein-alanine N-acetyltransferase
MSGRTAPEKSLPEIRITEPADVPAIVAIEHAVFPDPWSRASFLSAMRQPNTRVSTALRIGRVVGYSVAIYAADEAELANIAVSPEERRRGVGSALLNGVLRESRKRGTRRLYLEVRESNAAAQAMYRRAGFSESGRRNRYYSGPVEDAVVMVCDVTEVAELSGK